MRRPPHLMRLRLRALASSWRWFSRRRDAPWSKTSVILDVSATYRLWKNQKSSLSSSTTNFVSAKTRFVKDLAFISWHQMLKSNSWLNLWLMKIWYRMRSLSWMVYGTKSNSIEAQGRQMQSNFVTRLITSVCFKKRGQRASWINCGTTWSSLHSNWSRKSMRWWLSLERTTSSNTNMSIKHAMSTTSRSFKQIRRSLKSSMKLGKKLLSDSISSNKKMRSPSFWRRWILQNSWILRLVLKFLKRFNRNSVNSSQSACVLSASLIIVVQHNWRRLLSTNKMKNFANSMRSHLLSLIDL